MSQIAHLPPIVDLDRVLAHSYRDFHVKGLDYLCLKRTSAETIKVYFFEGDVATAPEVVSPHDHRYDFETTVLAGVLRNFRYAPACGSLGQVYERFAYMTPLNGGDGFTWEAEERLAALPPETYSRGAWHSHMAEEAHTIAVQAGTVITLRQFADSVPLDRPTRCWRPAGDRSAPNVADLYRMMDADRAVELIRLAYDLVGWPAPRLHEGASA